jgi:poly(3-hydroxybutyrate) depolymerase
MQPKVGHYGVFNGSRFRAEIAPRIADFVLSNNQRYADGSNASSRAKSRNGA